jgi:hypothetical protein
LESDPPKRETRQSTQQQTAVSIAKVGEKTGSKVRRTRMALNNDGHIAATLANVFDVGALVDYDADDNILSRTMVSRLAATGLFIPTLNLSTPITLQLTAKDMTANATEKVQVTLTLRL